MKQTLKSFLKEVHPDRFAHAPQKQAVNERSLAGTFPAHAQFAAV